MGETGPEPPREATEAPPWQAISPRPMRFGQCPLGAHSIPPPRVGVISNAIAPSPLVTDPGRLRRVAVLLKSPNVMVSPLCALAAVPV